MDLTISPRARALQSQALDFFHTHILPRHREWVQLVEREGQPAPFVNDLRALARQAGLWNLALPDLQTDEPGSRLSNLEFASIAETLGRLPWASQVFNCQAPDVPNMVMMQALATPAQRRLWLAPLLNGDMRSAFAMTEPDVASSDAGNISTRLDINDESIRINGHKWFATGAAHPDCRFLIVMGVSDPDAKRTSRHSMVIVPLDTPGVTVRRELSYLGWTDNVAPIGEITLEGVEVPHEYLLGERGQGFKGAQVRLAPARVHHSMRCIGLAEMLLSQMIARASERTTFGRTVIDYDSIQQTIARARVQIEQARLLVLVTAWKLDTLSEPESRRDISLIKVAVPNMLQWVADQALQIFGAMGGTSDTLIHHAFCYARWFRIGDGPDEVHLRQIFKLEDKPSWSIADCPYISTPSWEKQT